MSVVDTVRRRMHTYTDAIPLNDFVTYDDYWARRAAGHQHAVRPRWKLAVEKIPNRATLLDVGCGPGEFLDYLRSQRPAVTARGTDVSAGAVESGCAHGLDLYLSDLTGEDAIEGKYDYVTCFEMIEHAQEAERVLVKMRDATTTQLIMSLPNIGHFEHRLRLGLFGRFPNTTIQFHAKEHIRHWTTRDFVEWAAHFGLRVVDVQGQWGLRGTPWREHPGLFAPQVVYTLVRA